MFKPGDEIICIDDVPFVLIDDFVFSNKGITLNKKYKVIRTFSSDNSVLIINDANCPIKCQNKLFVSETEYRRMKIEKIRKKQSWVYKIKKMVYGTEQKQR